MMRGFIRLRALRCVAVGSSVGSCAVRSITHQGRSMVQLRVTGADFLAINRR